MFLAVVRSLDLPISELTRFSLDGQVLKTKEKIELILKGLAFLAVVGGSFYLPKRGAWGRSAFLSMAVISFFANNAVFCHLDKVFSGKAFEENDKKFVIYQMQICGFILAAAFGRLAVSDFLSGVRYIIVGIRSKDVFHTCMGVSWIFRTLGYDALLSWLFFRFSISHFSEKALEGWAEKMQKIGESSLGEYFKKQTSSSERPSFSQFILTVFLMIDKFWEEQILLLAVANLVTQEDLKKWYRSIEKYLDDSDILTVKKTMPSEVLQELFSKETLARAPNFQEEKEPGSFSLRMMNVVDQSISILVWATIAAIRPKVSGLGAAGGFVCSKIFANKNRSQTPAPHGPAFSSKDQSKSCLSYVQSLASRLSLLWFGASSPIAFYSGVNLFFASQRALARIIEKTYHVEHDHNG